MFTMIKDEHFNETIKLYLFYFVFKLFPPYICHFKLLLEIEHSKGNIQKWNLFVARSLESKEV